MRVQTIPHGIWTRVLGTDMEVLHSHGANYNVWVSEGGAIHFRQNGPGNWFVRVVR